MVFKKNSETPEEVIEEKPIIPEEPEESSNESKVDLRSTYIDAINSLCKSIQAQIDSLYQLRQLLQELPDDK